MGVLDFRNAYEFDPETYGGEGGGLPDMLRGYAQQGFDFDSNPSGATDYNPDDYGSPQGGLPGRLGRYAQQQGIDLGPTPSGAPEYNPDSYNSPQGGLLGRLLALQTQQGRYQPIPENSGQVPSAPQNPNFWDAPNSVPLPMSGSPAPQAEASGQQAKETEIARLVHGIRNLTGIGGPLDLDPMDIAKSAGIGLLNGWVNAAGLPGDVMTGFGYFPNNFVPNLFRRMSLLPQIPSDQPDDFKSWTSNELRRSLERNITSEFYQPKSRAGRYAETIGEMVPMVLGGEAAGVRFGAQTAGAALRKLPGTLAKHAVAPGVAVQALQEALPDSKAGQTLQKAYPVLRRILPAALATKRYLGSRTFPP